jgi:hypothetical protein
VSQVVEQALFTALVVALVFLMAKPVCWPQRRRPRTFQGAPVPCEGASLGLTATCDPVACNATRIGAHTAYVCGCCEMEWTRVHFRLSPDELNQVSSVTPVDPRCAREHG